MRKGERKREGRGMKSKAEGGAEESKQGSRG